MNKKIVICISIFILLIISILIYVKFNKSNNLNNILIFNLFENSEQNQYKFDISEKSKQTVNTSLYSSVNMKGLANEKLAPGTKGNFNITLSSSKNIKYKINFESKNTKPKNLEFKIKNNKSTYNSLEELQENLYGNLKENEEKNICIEWMWEYEKIVFNDIQDTIDGTNLKEYNFDIKIVSFE